MIKLYVTLRSDYSDRDREYEISNELAELLRRWAFRETWDNLTDEERTCDKFDLDLEQDDIYDMLNSQEGIPENVIKELKSITDDAESEAFELAVECTIDDNPPTEFFLEERMSEDIEAGLFTPSLTFEQYLDEEDWDTSDEDYDEEDAREEYEAVIFDEYQEWVDALPPSDRADRWGFDNWEIVGDHSFVFSSINKAVKVTVPKTRSRATKKQNKRKKYTIVDGKCIIDDGVTAIGSNFFNDRIKEQLQFVVIPASVKEIGEHAFHGCSNLTNVEIPSSVKLICDYAFAYCPSLKSIEIPSSVRTIGTEAFNRCSALTSIKIPSSVERIDGSAFRCPNLESIIVSPENRCFDSRDNCNAIICSESNTLLYGCKNTTIPSSVTCIGSHAFEDCSGLTEIEIPSSVESIGGSAFHNSGLTHIEIPSSVTNIGRDAFWSCRSLTSIELSSSVNYIGFDAFEDCSNLEKITVSPGNKFFDSRDNCNALICSESDTLLYGCKNTLIPDSVKTIGDSAFKGSGLTSIEIPSSVTIIKDSAFASCSNLTSIVIPASVTYIGKDAFSSCSKLTSIVIPSSINKIEKCAFAGCSALTDIKIPSSIESIGECAFCNSGLAHIEIPSSVTNIGYEAFGGCSNLESIIVSPENIFFDSRDNCNAIICSESDTLLFGCKNTSIPDSVKKIGNDAFRGCTGLTSIEIPSSVTSIGCDAFAYCSNLTSIVIPSSVKCIWYNAFSHCRGLTHVEIPGSAKEDVKKIFDGCYNLKDIVINED